MRTTIKPYTNLDKVVAFGLRAAYQAMNGWLRGLPLEEVALMNRILEKLRYNDCPPWREPPYYVQRNLFMLHRQGPGNTDAHGSDFAVTINIFDENSWSDGSPSPSLFSKTALFQLKTGDDYKPSLIEKQLADTKGIFANRSFVLYGNQKTGEYRVQAVKPLLSRFGKQKTKTFDASQWLSLSEWLVQWLTCKQGLFSTDRGRRWTVGRLAQFYVRPEISSEQSYEQQLITAFIQDSTRIFDQPFSQREGKNQQEGSNKIDDGFPFNQVAVNLGIDGPVAWLNINIYVSAPIEQNG